MTPGDDTNIMAAPRESAQNGLRQLQHKAAQRNDLYRYL